jgi:formylglycine-generating enzyme required for sulfatase activity
MSIQEVTRSHFLQFVEATGYKPDAEKDGKGGYGFIDGKDVQSLEFLWNSPPLSYDPPVVNISWDDAVAFSKWLSSKEGVTYRLPTEAEWEWCCRAGSLSRYSHGDDESLLKEYAVYALDHPTPPSKKTANGLGLFDMQGNVWEWCHDTFAAYTAESTVDPVGPHQGNSRSLRGGGYYGTPLITRSAVRLNRTPNSWYSAIGFRIVRTFEKPTETGNTQPKNAPVVAPMPDQKSVKSDSN